MQLQLKLVENVYTDNKCLFNSLFYVKNDLSRDGFKEVTKESELIGKTFLIDEQFDDIISFPNEILALIEHYPMVNQGILVMQVTIKA